MESRTQEKQKDSTTINVRQIAEGCLMTIGATVLITGLVMAGGSAYTHLVDNTYRLPVLEGHSIFKTCDKGLSIKYVPQLKYSDYIVTCRSSAFPTTISKKYSTVDVNPYSYTAKGANDYKSEVNSFATRRNEYTVGNPRIDNVMHAWDWLTEGSDSVMVVFTDNEDISRISVENFVSLTEWELNRIEEYLLEGIKQDELSDERTNSWGNSHLFTVDVKNPLVEAREAAEQHETERTRMIEQAKRDALERTEKNLFRYYSWNGKEFIRKVPKNSVEKFGIELEDNSSESVPYGL
ncbi:hypothetical protein [Vibrio crassostreae]|uniref:hypothetical protein n=1 Tax=Vibrio crassostreae TaxID=246167 RepID=UPI001B300C05|nr:hypothetical protein [Vibrio crassostreae]